jgi:hypothetical protein
LISPLLALPALIAVTALSVLAAVDMSRVDPPRGGAGRRLRFRAKVAAYHLLQPLVRWWARSRHRQVAHRNLKFGQTLPAAVRRLRGGVVVVPEDRPRAELAAALVDALRRRGIRAISPNGWEDYDARLLLSPLLYGDLQTSSHPEGFVQVRIRTRPRWQAITVAIASALAVALVSTTLLVVLVAPVASLMHAAYRARRLPAKVLPTDSS